MALQQVSLGLYIVYPFDYLQPRLTLRFICILYLLFQVGSVIKNPEIAALVPTLLRGLSDPNEHTKYSLDILLQVWFMSYALLILFSLIFCCF